TGGAAAVLRDDLPVVRRLVVQSRYSIVPVGRVRNDRGRWIRRAEADLVRRGARRGPTEGGRCRDPRLAARWVRRRRRRRTGWWCEAGCKRPQGPGRRAGVVLRDDLPVV